MSWSQAVGSRPTHSSYATQRRRRRSESAEAALTLILPTYTSDALIDQINAAPTKSLASSVLPADNYPTTFPDTGNVTSQANKLYACSVKGVVPSRAMHERAHQAGGVARLP